MHSITEYTKSIIDLSHVLDSLKDGDFPDDSWRKLGLKLGLRDRTLNIIKSDNSESKYYLKECISKWLMRVDDVDKSCKMSVAIGGSVQKSPL